MTRAWAVPQADSTVGSAARLSEHKFQNYHETPYGKGIGLMDAIYDRIGVGYRRLRRPDPRLASLIGDAIGDALTVVNVGAGAGSYEPAHPWVVAVEPSSVMLAQHPGRTRVRAGAEALPFPDRTFDAAMAIMTIHHWQDLRRGLAEMQRVARRQVVFTWDPEHHQELWIVAEYLPEIRAIERSRFRPLTEVARLMGAHTISVFEIPHDFRDGYQPAFWRRPEAYLDADIRSASSTFAQLAASVVEPAIRRLESDLASGRWVRRHNDLLTRESMDYGYRLLVAG
jgi:SAM-dependent methyltransferase